MALPIGDIIRLISSQKQYKRLKNRQQDAGDIGQRIEALKEFRPELNIDTSGYDQYTNVLENALGQARSRTQTAQYEKAVAGGRPEADALMREENRRTTANTIAQAKNTIGSQSDTLAALAIADAQERARNRQIDVESSQQIQSNKQAANAAYQQALGQQMNATQAYSNSLFATTQAKNIAEQQMFQTNQMDPYMQALFEDRSMQELIDQARGNRNMSFAQGVDNYYAKQQQMKMDTLNAILGFGGGAFGGSDTKQSQAPSQSTGTPYGRTVERTPSFDLEWLNNVIN